MIPKTGVRLTGGTARNAKLFGVPGSDVRPALARMRQSIFEILRLRLEGMRVLDLFAGTGCLGLEALSRGAAEVVFLDIAPGCVDVIRLNLDKLKFGDRAELLRVDAFLAAKNMLPADLAFVDPPYDYFQKRKEEMKSLVETVVGGCGLVLVEHRARQGLGEIPGAKITDERYTGTTVVDFYEPA